jgi:diaminohydroxyphosphoribosylaminopyrimidine deaminase/5-amino-6-(5-phosphoribosylamino)uracil reductase
MKLRAGADAILVGSNTVRADDPSLTVRGRRPEGGGQTPEAGSRKLELRPRRIVLDSRARTPLAAKVVADEVAAGTTIVVTADAPARRVVALAKRARVVVAPRRSAGGVDLRWLLRRLGAEGVTNLLVEGGGEVNASFLLAGLAQRIAFLYAPRILGGREARKAVAGDGVRSLKEALRLREVKWSRLGPDLLLTARLAGC